MSEKTIQTPEEILEERIDKIHQRREWKRFVVECIVLAAAVYVVFQYVIGIAFVSGNSMQPTLQDGELVVFYRLDKEYQKNDIVIVHQEGNQEYIKRVFATEAEVVELEGMEEAVKVPENSYFVLGDNLEVSRDSRTFGTVKEEAVIGRVFFHLGLTK